MGEADEAGNSEDSDPAKSETTPEGGNGSEETSGEKEEEGQTPAEDSSEGNTDDSTEEPAEEVVNPAIDPEDPAVPTEEPEDTEGANTVNGAEVNVDEETFTVSIDDFESVSAYITASATVGGNRDKGFAKTGALTAAKSAAVVVTITAKSGAKITSVKNGDTTVTPADGTYTITLASLAADTSITVEAASAYSLTTDFTGTSSAVTGIKLDASLKDAAGAANDAALTVTSAEITQGEDLKFTLVGTAAGDDARYNVFYQANGSDERTAIDAVPESVGEGQSATKVDTYTVKKEDLADFHSIEIIVEKESKVDLEELLDTALTANTDVNVVYWGTRKANVTTGEAAAWVEGTTAGNYDAITKAYVGESFKFKAVVKESVANKAVSKVTKTVGGKEETITAGTDGSYSITVPSDLTAFSIETDYTTTATNKLTYTLKDTCDKDSVATVEITKIVAGSTTASTAEDIEAYLGGKSPSATLTAGEAVSILKTSGEDEITEIQVTVTPAADYKVVKGAADKHITIAAADGTGPAVYKFTKTAGADSIAIAEAMAVTVETDVVETAAANDKFFMVSRDKGTEASPKNTHISDPVVTLVTDKVVAVPTSASDTTTKAYEVKGGVKTVEFKVTADAGYQLKNASSYTGFKSIKDEAAADGKVTYTVTLFASKLVSEDVDSPTAIAVEEDGIKLEAEVKPAAEASTGNYSASQLKYYTKDDPDTAVDYTSGKTIPYGSKLTTEITAAAGCHLVSVSYNMGGTDTPVTLSVDGKAAVVIPEVTAKVTISVTAEKDYKKTELTKAPSGAVDKTGDVYSVRYDEAYLVGLTNGNVDVPVKEFKAVVKDETGTEVKLPRITTGTKLKIDLARAKTSVAGQTITIDMVVGDKVVDTYILSVNKKTSKLTIEGVAKAEKEQRVDSVVKYAIDTDGEVDITDTTDTIGTGSIIQDAEIVGNNLVVTLKPMTTSQITKTAAVGTTPAVYHSATITLTSDDDPDLEASLVVTAQPFIDDITNKEITLEAGDQADTVLNVKLGLDGVAAPESGKLYYELTVTPKPATGTTLSDKLLSSVTVAPVDKRGSSQNVKIQVAKSGRLGEGAACDYEVKAKLTYDVDSGTTKESTKEVTSADFKTIDGKEIKYENNLKLTKDKNFKGTLYTGQSGEIVIANPKWSTKNVTYKILSDGITDEAKYDSYGNRLTGLTVRQNASGQIVVTNVPQYTWLGKHTITVEATADQTTDHEMYKSRATIAVTVAKGIEDISVTPASEKIYKKDARSKATLKMTAVLNDFYGSSASSSWDGKKYTKAPKSKSLKWELVGAGSYDGNDIALPESFGNKAVTINAKSGAITVDKKFALSKNAANNRFCVKATATDYAGNTAVGYSEDIEITGDALSIEKLALVRQTGRLGAYNYEIVAVQNANNEELKLDATAVDGTFVIVVPKGVDLAKEYTGAQWSTLSTKLIDPANYSVTSGGKKIVEVQNGNNLNVLAAGKRVKLTVTANDGSKQKRVLPLNLGWTGAEKDLALGIQFKDSETFDVFNPNTEYKTQKDKAAIAVKDITATGAVRLSITLMEGDKSEGSSTTFNEADSYINYKLAAKGGKLTYNNHGSAELVTTAKVTTLTLTIGTGRTAKKSVYTITNKAYALEGKAPKVTVKGSLHENGHKSEQQVTMIVKNGSDFYGKKAAKVEIDWSSMNQKNRDTLYLLNNSLTSNVIQLNDKTGEMTLSFAYPGEEYIGFTPGSYKLKVTVGTGTTAANFKAETLPANATLKVAKNKTFTFKPQTSYTIGKIDGGAILTGKGNAAKGEKTYMNFYDLKNANVAGRPNDFTHYFTIEYDAINNTQRLVLNDSDPVFKEKFGITAQAPLDWDTIDLTKIDKKDLTGYVSYDARASKKFYGIGTNGWSNEVSGTVKITVKLAANPKNENAWKASLKYTTNKAEVLAKDNEKAVINVMSGNEYVTVGAAVVYETDQLKADTINEKGQILIAVKGVEAKKTYSANMKVVPLSSRFMDAVEAVKADKAKYQAAIEKYGIPVKVTIVAKATAAEVTATPDPVTVASALNLIYSNPNPWTAKLTAEDLGDIKEAEMNAAKNALATEVGNYLKNHALKAYNTGFTVTGIRVVIDEEDVITAGDSVPVVLTIEKGSDLEEFWIEIAAEEGSGTVTPTVASIVLAAAGGATSVAKDSTLVFTATLKDDQGNAISDLDNITVTWDVTGKTNASGTTIAADPSEKNKATLTVASNEEGTEDTADGNKKKLTVTVTAGGVTQTAKVEVTT